MEDKDFKNKNFLSILFAISKVVGELLVVMAIVFSLVYVVANGFQM